jgi:hypothetical protein
MTRTRAVSAALMLMLSSTLTVAVAADGSPTSETQSLQELRNTVINLLDSLIQKGVITAEQAREMVSQAQAKAAADTQAKTAQQSAQEAEEKNAVRVPYVPQIVRDQISEQVATEVRPQVVQDVLQQAKTERWGIPGAWPEWVSNVRVIGDMRLRAEGELFPAGNASNYWLDFNAINTAGGFSKAGQAAFMDTTHDYDRLRIRGRLGAVVTLSPEWTAGVRIATGSPTDPASESQTLGTGAARYNVGFDQAFIRWDKLNSERFPLFTFSGGRIADPWFAPTTLLFHPDLTFEGVAATGRLGLGDHSASQPFIFLTAGAFPIQQFNLFNGQDKWLLAGQFGSELHWGGGQKLTLAVAYYDYIHVSGVRNQPDLTLTNYTAPTFIRFGNSVFDISNSTTDPTINLFALAAQFRLENVAMRYEVPFGSRSLLLSAEAVRNVGYKVQDVLQRSGLLLPARNNGNQEELSFGSASLASLNGIRAGDWRAGVGYRYVQRDATIDAWTDADFHYGGTNARGYYLIGNVGLARSTYLQLKYMSSDVIDAPQPMVTFVPPYSLDSIYLDLNAVF